MEATADDGQDDKKKKWSNKWMLILGGSLLLLIVLALVLPLALLLPPSSDNSKNEPQPEDDANNWRYKLVQLGGDVPGGFTKMAFSASGEVMATANEEKGTIQVSKYDFTAREWIYLGSPFTFGGCDIMCHIALDLSEDGKTLVIGFRRHLSGYLEVYQLGGDVDWHIVGSRITGPEGDEHYFGSPVAVSRDGKIVSAGGRHILRVYEYDDNVQDWALMGNPDKLPFTTSGTDISLAKGDGRTLAVASRMSYGLTGKVVVYRYEGFSTWKQMGPEIVGEDLGGQLGRLVALSYDGRTVATAAGMGAVRVYDYEESHGNSYPGGIWKKRGSDLLALRDNIHSLDISDNASVVAIGRKDHNYYGSADLNQSWIYRWKNEINDYSLATPSNLSAVEFVGNDQVALSSNGTLLAISTWSRLKPSQGGHLHGYSKVFRLEKDLV